MPDSSFVGLHFLTQRTATAINSINDIDSSDWNQCANPEQMEYNPFLDHRFIKALEDSGSANSNTGWQPFHTIMRDKGRVVGVVPAYLKSHSQGEYVFDGAWADAWYRAGGEYYPKLQISIPFTPATGRRLLVATPLDNTQSIQEVEAQLLSATLQIAQKIQVSSLHITFMPKNQWENAGKLGLLKRVDTQFHWTNANYDSFEDFLRALSSKKRKNIRRERRGALENNIEIEWITGSDLTESHWDAFYQFYVDTGNRKWGTPYLTRAFFSMLSETMPDETLLIMCKREGKYIAGAINFIGSNTLFGRNWGCIEDHRFLHFETCYYQAIDFAIQHGINRVEAGAQGGHKIARGYMPQQTYSAHWIRNSEFRDAIKNYLNSEESFVQQDIDWIEKHTPFRKDLDLTKYHKKLD
ncbi:MAG TPA: GNAT family N-acetyltransferase [Gammaproteobacteria bacterium]|nr:GNAT family N-acetyltransferase [Gammaproteobacteria bacterium]